VIPILWQRVEHEIFADAAHAPRLGFRFKRTDHHLAGVGFVIGAFVRHPQHGQMAKALHRLGNQVEMLTGMQRQGDAGLLGQIAAPHAATVHHNIGGDMARLAIGIDVIDAAHPAIGARNTHHLGMFENLRATHPRALGQRHGNIGRVTLAVQRQMHRPYHILHIQMRIHRLHLIRRNLGHINIKNPRHRGLAQ